MKLQKADAYSANYILGTFIVAGVCIVIACGQSLWIPASRIENLYARSIVLSLTDTGATFASSTGLDGFVPALRTVFLDATGLSSHTSWDTRYYNRRNGQLPVSPVSETLSAPDILPEDSLPAEIVSETASVIDANAILGSAPKPQSSQMHSTENPLDIFVFGDSQVFSLGSGLSRLAGKNSPVNVNFLAIHSSGFIRGDYYNWPAKLADTFRESNYEGAVMMLGMNDYQSFWNSKGEIMKKHTPGWEEAYKDKCRSLIDIALLSVPRLYWVGMPVVKNKEYNDSLAYIDSVQDSLAREYSPDILIRISLQKTETGEARPYTESVDLGGGKIIKAMSGDGTHFTVEGGQLAMAPLYNRFISDYLFTEVPVAILP